MRRVSVLVAVLAALFVLGLGPGTSAQDLPPTITPLPEPTPASSTIATASRHPIVGSWSETRNGGAHITFFADGNVIMTDGDGQTWHGAWLPADRGEIIATYVIQSWGSVGGQGIEDYAAGVTGDELTLGLGTFRRLNAPDAASIDRGGTTAADSATPTGGIAVESAPDSASHAPPTACRVEPRTAESVRALVASATPAAEDDVIDGAADLPRGGPADPDTVAAVIALEREFAGCINDFDYPRWLALVTDDGLSSVVGPDEVDDLFAASGTPDSGNTDDRPRPIQILSVSVRDVRILPDGRAGAIVAWAVDQGFADETPSITEESETNYHIYERVDGRWLLDEEL